jgi:hypothetical protein
MKVLEVCLFNFSESQSFCFENLFSPESIRSDYEEPGRPEEFHLQSPTDIPHNAHQNQFIARVYYPFHPRSGEDIYIVGIRRHREEQCYVMALNDGKHELIPAWMTHPEYGKISLVPTPSLEIEALRNLRLLLNSAKQSFLGKIKSKTRRDNGETKRASTSDHLGVYTIPYLNSS